MASFASRRCDATLCQGDWRNLSPRGGRQGQGQGRMLKCRAGLKKTRHAPAEHFAVRTAGMAAVGRRSPLGDVPTLLRLQPLAADAGALGSGDPSFAKHRPGGSSSR
eukprot:scaffold2208_cov237-Pinguiococcus_pyrenoidosus.AAC.2